MKNNIDTKFYKYTSFMIMFLFSITINLFLISETLLTYLIYYTAAHLDHQFIVIYLISRQNIIEFIIKWTFMLTDLIEIHLDIPFIMRQCLIQFSDNTELWWPLN